MNMNEFTVKSASRIANRKNCVFKLHKDDNITWSEAKMRRENEYQPWQIKFGSGRAARKFKAIKEGGVGDNASYFIFYKSKDSSDTYEVCPVEEWYSVSATQRYKTLTAEEAEQKFEQRHKTLNLFSVMHLKKNGEAGEEGGHKSESKGFKVSEMDDWEDSGDNISGSDKDGLEGDDASRKKRRKKTIKKEKDDPEEAPDEGKEDSDEGDMEQREVDYMSDSSSNSSDSEEDNKNDPNIKGIAEEEALRDLLSTDDEEDAETNVQQNPSIVPYDTKDIKEGQIGNESDESSDSEDYDVDEDKMDNLFMKKSLPTQLVEQGVSRNCPDLPDGTPAPAPQSAPPPPQQQQQSVTSTPNALTSPLSRHEKRIEDLVKKYLRRKPMTLKILLSTIRKKLSREGLDDSNVVEPLARIIPRLNPTKQKTNGVLYFSLND